MKSTNSSSFPPVKAAKAPTTPDLKGKKASSRGMRGKR